MSGNEEADAAAGTPDEGKKLTFAERRELERKKKEEEARDAGERPSGALGRGGGGFDRVKREEETRGRDDGRGDRSRSRSGSRERKKHRKHRRHRSTSHSSDDSDSRSRSRDRKSHHRKERRSDKKRRHDRSRSRSREGRHRSGDGGQGTAVSDAQLAQNPALAAMAAMAASWQQQPAQRARAGGGRNAGARPPRARASRPASHLATAFFARRGLHRLALLLCGVVCRRHEVCKKRSGHPNADVLLTRVPVEMSWQASQRVIPEHSASE